jgi:SAM-dependent methyltransferase
VAKDDQDRWDGRHAAGAPVEPGPPDALRGREDLLPAAGRALDVACGRGAVAVWLALRGLTVDAVDVSPVGLDATGELAARHGVPERVRRHRHDLDAGLPAAVGSGFAVVVCQRFRAPALYPRLAAALAPGGLLAVSVLSGVGGADGPFRAAPGELLAAFADLHVLHHREGDGEAALLARAPGPVRP